MSLLQNSNAISAGGYDINNSLRFRSSASASLSRTPASAGNRKTFTWSAWVKRGLLGSASYELTRCYIDTANSTTFIFDAERISCQSYLAGTNVINVTSTQVFRDPSAWYHFVLFVDTTQATAANRVKMYVNGNQITALASTVYPSQNTDIPFNTANITRIGAGDYPGFPQYFDGYMTEINFIDGQALTPSSFGETDTDTGTWKAKKYTGTYGTNGFYLKFSDTSAATAAAIGKDSSGNANNWTPNNISVTAGTTYDAMIDSPTNASATVANYPTLNPVYVSNIKAAPTLADANLTTNTAYDRFMNATMALPSSGKFYWEATVIAATSGGNQTGLGINTNQGDNRAQYGFVSTVNDVWGVAVDMTALTITWYKNNVSQSSSSITANLEYFPFFYTDTNSSPTQRWSVNFGQRPFSYTPPTGFVRLNTYNLSDSTIKKGNVYMDATIYSGNSTNNRSIVNDASFRPDLVWIKPRNNPDVHQLYDTIRGAGNNSELQSNSTAAEGSNNSEVYGYMSAFTSTGFTVAAGTDSVYPYALVNMSGRTYVGWQWQAGSSTVTNTSGSLSSQVRANPTAGFSVVTFTKTGTATVKTVGHGLGVAPSMIIAKVRNGVDNWPVYHISNGATFYQELNTMVGKSSGDPWGNTTPTSSVFSVKDNGTGTQVAYCWAEIAGYSKFSSYVGNGSADGPFVYTGFRPKLILLKTTNTGTLDNWYILDSIRNTYNVVDNWIVPNTTDAENNGGAVAFVDFVSNGFKVRNSGAFVNSSGVSYIYAAFAENPFKNANAR